MARKGYPFSKRDVNFGANLIASLFAIPISLTLTSLFQPIKSNKRGGNTIYFFKPRPFNFKHYKNDFHSLGVVRVCFPILGMLVGLLDCWLFPLMLYYLFFTVFDFIFYFGIQSPFSFMYDIEHILIFESDQIAKQKVECRYLMRFSAIISTVLFVLYWYPIIYYFAGLWDGGITVGLNITFIVITQTLRGFFTFRCYLADKVIDASFAKNQSI